MPPTPQITRKTDELTLDQFNQAMRASPLYQNFMQSRGLRTDGHVRLTDRQQGELEQELARSGIPIHKDMHIDQGGNLNQHNRTGRNIAITAAIAAAAFGGAAALGAFGASGAAGAGGAAGAAGAGGAAAGGGLTAGAYGTLAGTVGGATYAPAAAGALYASGGAAAAGGAGASLFGGLGSSILRDYAVPGAISAIQGYMGADAARDAARTQSEAADRAMALAREQYQDTSGLQRQIYEDTRNLQGHVYQQGYNNFVPYMQGGHAGMSNLTQMVGGAPITAPRPEPMTAPIGPTKQPKDMTMGATGVGQPLGTPPLPVPEPVAQGRGDPFAPPGQAGSPQFQAELTSGSSYTPSGSLGELGGGLITMVSPDGSSTRQVTPQQATMLEARGARRVA